MNFLEMIEKLSKFGVTYNEVPPMDGEVAYEISYTKYATGNSIETWALNNGYEIISRDFGKITIQK